MESSVSRCPIEIWMEIFKWTEPVQPFNAIEHPLEVAELRQQEITGIQEATFIRRTEAVSTMQAMVLVCRAWRDLISPALLQWSLVHLHLERHSRNHTIQMFYQPWLENSTKASRIRRLEFKQRGDSYLPAILSVGIRKIEAWHERLYGLMDVCSSLEEFVWDGEAFPTPFQLLPRLAAACGRTLTSLILNGEQHFAFADVPAFLRDCPRLSALVGGTYRSSSDSQHQAEVNGSVISCGLRTLSLNAHAHNAPLFTLLASTSLPHLRHLRIDLSRFYLDLSLTDNNVDPTSQVSAIRVFFQIHGARLHSLDVNLSSSREVFHRDRGAALLLLNLCPNVEEFTFDFIRGDLANINSPHPMVKRIGCRYFFQGDIRETTLSMHLERVKEAIRTLCSPYFPNLEVIRCLDVACLADLRCRRLDFQEDYRALMEEMTALCQRRSVRLENCLGQLVQPDFAPRYPSAACEFTPSDTYEFTPSDD